MKTAEWLTKLRSLGVASVAVVPGAPYHKAVLAENVDVQKDKYGALEITFDFLCSNCGKRHVGFEIDGPLNLLIGVGYRLACGWVNIRMPWFNQPARDRKNVYGKTVAS